MDENLEMQLSNQFTCAQIIAAKSILEEWEDMPEFSEGINRELCLTWVCGDVKTIYEVHRTGVVLSHKINISSQSYETGSEG